MRLSRTNFGSKWKRFAWQIPEAQGSDLSGNLFVSLAKWPKSFAAMKASAVLQLFVVVIDRELELA